MKHQCNKTYAFFTAFFAVVCVAFYSTAATFPEVRNYYKSDYSAGTQNWAVASAEDGVMLFGNSYGLLAFDSRIWHLSQNINHSTVRSIFVDNNEHRIYTGSSDDFGYFYKRSGDRDLSYHSLRGTLPDSLMQIHEVWDIHFDGRTVWFRSDFNVLGYDGTSTIVITTPHKITASALIGNELYLGFINGDFGRVEGREVRMLSPGVIPKDQRVSAIVPYKDRKVWICTPFAGIFEFDGHQISSIRTDIDAFLRENQLFCASASERAIAFGTVNCGVVVKDIATGTNIYANTETGLQNNTVLCAEFDPEGNLWLGLDNGLGYLRLDYPVTRLLGARSVFGAGYTSIMLDGRLYLGTNQGLYSIPYPTAPSPSIPDVRTELQGQVWDLDSADGDLVVCNDNGLYHKPRGGRFYRVPDVPGSLSAVPLRSYPGLILVSTYENFYLVAREGGRLRSLGRVEGYNEAVGNPYEDPAGNIWLTHWLKGIYRLRLDPARMRFTDVRLINHGDGLPTDGGNVASLLDDETVISSTSGIYRFDNKTGHILPYDELNSRFGSLPTSRFYRTPDGDIWAVSTKNVVVATTDSLSRTLVDSVTYRPLAEHLIPGFENLNFLSPSQMIMASQDGFFHVDVTPGPATLSAGNPVEITAVYAGEDSLVMNSRFFRAHTAETKLPYSLNSLKIEYIAPDYTSIDAMRYSTMMEPIDSHWSAWSTANAKEYTDLAERDYVFRVRALNRYTGQISETSFPFTIAPPWYRSTLAYVVYLLIFIALVCVGTVLVRRITNLKAAKVSLQKERELEEMRRATTRDSLEKDYEIARLKSEQLEHDIKHKSGELSSITMNVIRKNEILLEISNRLTQLAKSVENDADTQRLTRQIDKIKTLIRENISHDDDWRTFTRNFDLVYENYLKRLLQVHPSLTQSDQRICAYIKMGLSSKEIAPLLNISYRSVEMSRYRIRKKMGLDGDTSLSDYLNTF